MQTLNIQQPRPEIITQESPMLSGRVYVYGDGMIGNATRRALARTLGADIPWVNQSVETDFQDVVLAAIDNSLIHTLKSLYENHHATILCVHVHLGQAIIGPILRFGHPGCLECWKGRYYGGRKEAHEWSGGAIQKQEEKPDPWLTPLSAAIIAEIAVHWAISLLQNNSEPPRWEAYYLSLDTLTGRRCMSLPDPLCPVCGSRPPDSAGRGHLQLVSRPKPAANGDRLRDVREFSDDLFDAYAMSPAGIVTEVKQLWRITNLAVATTYVALRNYSGSNYREPCSGFTDRYSIARAVSIIEGLERYVSTRPRDREFVVHDSLSNLGDKALDPREFGWFNEQAYVDNANWLTRFDENLKVDFVWGYSFRRQSPVLIPAQLVYYMEPSGKDPTYVIDSSVGCSMGSAAEEAILHGVLEVLERDSLLLHWYAGHSLPAFDVMECSDPEVRSHYRRLQLEGYEIFALDGTTDFGIPAVILIARNRSNVIPYSGCIAAAHPMPERAVRKAFRELIPGLRRYGKEVREDKHEHACSLVRDYSRLRTMEDHAYLYALPESAGLLDRILSGGRTSLKELHESGQEFCSTDLTEELQRIVARVLSTARDILVINQTAPELHRVGLYCYKVMVQGAIPMTWGQQMRRIEGMPRLERALNGALPNLVPHPFP